MGTILGERRTAGPGDAVRTTTADYPTLVARRGRCGDPTPLPWSSRISLASESSAIAPRQHVYQGDFEGGLVALGATRTDGP
jgi:hypothetical protein